MAPIPPELELFDRRQSGLIRVPFIRRCSLDFGAGPAAGGFIVNINVLGAYVARDELANLGQALTVRFGLPDTEHKIVAQGTVVWVNPRQQHPVHSLPAGFGMKFRELTPDDRRRIERVITDYVANHPQR